MKKDRASWKQLAGKIMMVAVVVMVAGGGLQWEQTTGKTFTGDMSQYLFHTLKQQIVKESACMEKGHAITTSPRCSIRGIETSMPSFSRGNYTETPVVTNSGDDILPFITVDPAGYKVVTWTAEYGINGSDIGIGYSMNGTVWTTSTWDFAGGAETYADTGSVVNGVYTGLYGAYLVPDKNSSGFFLIPDVTNSASWSVYYWNPGDSTEYEYCYVDDDCFYPYGSENAFTNMRVYHEIYGSYDISSCPVLDYVTYPSIGGTFYFDGQSQLITAPASYPSMANTPQYMHLVWSYFNGTQNHYNLVYKRVNPATQPDIEYAWPQFYLDQGSYDCRYPDVDAVGSKVYVVYAKNDGATYDIILKYSSDYGLSWSEYTVANESSTDELYPAVYAMADRIYVAYIKDNNLYLVHSDDDGITWSVPEQINSQNHSVSMEEHAVDMCYGGMVWVDTRNGNKDVFYASFIEDDVGVASINSPVDENPPGTYAVNATFKNYGSKDQPTVPVNCSIYNLTWTNAFADDIESGQDGWYTWNSSDSPDLWHITSSDYHTPTHSWYCGNETTGTYANNMQDHLISPTWIDLTDAVSATLHFWMKYDLEPNADYLILNIYYYENGPHTNYLYWWTGYQDWTEMAVDLSQFAGKNIQVAFIMDTDDSGTYSGAWIDDVIVEKEVPSTLVFYDDKTIALNAGDTKNVVFNSWSASEVGGYLINVSTRLSDDEIPDNNFMESLITIAVSTVDIDVSPLHFSFEWPPQYVIESLNHSKRYCSSCKCDALTPEQAYRLMKKNDNVTLIDVRPQEKFSTMHIPGAICVPYEGCASCFLENMEEYRYNILILYDDTGITSRAACSSLMAHNFGSAHVLQGGISKWHQQGFSVTGAESFTENMVSPFHGELGCTTLHLGERKTPPIRLDSTPPSSWDWRSATYHNITGDWTTIAKGPQLGCGSCWDFAAHGALEAIINIRENNPNLDLDLSEQYILSCATPGYGCGGYNAYWAYAYMMNNRSGDEWHPEGALLEQCFPYTGNDDTPCCNKCANWTENLIPIVDYGEIDYPTLDTIKQLIYQHGPVCLDFAVYSDFYYPSPSWNPQGVYTYDGTSSYEGHHQVVAVGYVDTPGNPYYDGYWICKNSWGPTWGPWGNGFFGIAYGECDIDDDVVWVDYQPMLKNYSYIEISNNGSLNLTISSVTVHYSSGEPAGWLDIYPDSFNITPASCPKYIKVMFNGSSLSSGVYHAWILIYSNDPDENPVNVSVNLTVTGANQPPVADFTFTPASPTIQDVIHFTDLSYDNDGTIVNWTWNFGDGNTSYLQNPSHQYTVQGIYNVSLTVRDDMGSSDTMIKQVILAPLMVYVDDDYTSSTPGWQYDHFDVIQDGINAVAEGGTVNVSSGTYYEHLTVGKTINLMGEDKNTTIIDGGGTGDIISITDDWVNISGFTVTNSGNETYYKGIGLYSNNCSISDCNISYNNAHGFILIGANNKISHCAISHNAYQGLLITESSYNNNISDCTMNSNGWSGICIAVSSNNTIFNCASLMNGFCGVYFYNCSSTYGNDKNKITNCQFANNDVGVYLYCSTNNTIIKNSFTTDGLFTAYSYHNVVANNTVNSKSLIYLEGISDIIVNSTFKNMAGQIILVNCTNITVKNQNLSFTCVGVELWNTTDSCISGNLITNNNRYGIATYYSHHNTIIGNTIANNDGKGLRIYYSDNNTITGNIMINNSNGLYLDSSSNNIIYNNYFNNTNNAYDYGNNVWNITKTPGTNIIGGPFLGGNFWSDYTGNDTDGDGLGDTNLPYNCSGNIQNGGDWLPLVPVSNHPPNKPTVSGQTFGYVGTSYMYFFNTTDIDNNSVYYYIDWGDGNTTGWIGPSPSGETVNIFHSWSVDGIYEVKAKAKDEYGNESEWSDALVVTVINLGAYDLVIISPNEFSNSLQSLVQHKQNYGISAFIMPVESIYGNFSGRDAPEKIKYFIKYAIESLSTQYVLLVGNESKIPVRYSHLDDGYETSFVSDLYYADVYKYDGGNITFEDWDSNGNGIFAEWIGINKDILDLYPDIYVGRLPCRNKSEVIVSVSKIISYEANGSSSWFNNIVLCGGDTEPISDPYNEGEVINNQIASYMQSDGFSNITLWASLGNLSVANISVAIDNGAGFIEFSGLGNATMWNTHPHSDNSSWLPLGNYTVSDILNLTNGNKLPVVVVGSSYSGASNIAHNSLARAFLFNPNGGGIATLGSTAIWHIATGDDGNGIPDCIEKYGGYMETLLFQKYAIDNYGILGDLWGNAITEYIFNGNPMSDKIDCKAVEEFILLGDPSLKIGGYGGVNRPPNKPMSPIPAHGATGVSTHTYLECTVSDPDDDTMDVSFYWVNGTLIGTDHDVLSGGTASIGPLSLDSNTTYYWYAVANDSQLENVSDTWNFTTVYVCKTLVVIDPASQIVTSGETFTVNITIDPGEPIAGAQADLLFDPSLITATAVIDGGMFDMWVDFNLEIDNVHGAIRNISAVDAGNVTTPGIFAIIEFTAGSAGGTSPLNLSNVIVGDPNGIPVNIEQNNGNVTVVLDNIPPEITGVMATSTFIPSSCLWEVNISSVVTDNEGVDEVYVNISYPDGTYENFSITQNTTGDIYYCNKLYGAVSDKAGVCEYYIWAKDIHGNQNTSLTYQFNIPPNWDVNGDGSCNVLDLIIVAQHWGETGEPGWIRADVNEDGAVNVLDLIIVAQHWGQQWVKTVDSPHCEMPFQTTMVNISPSAQTVSPGETFTVNITINPGEPIAGAQADLLFDPSLITATAVIDGGMFDMWVDFNLEIDNVHGAIRNISAVDMGNVTTPGTFAIIEFTAGSAGGTSPLNLSNVIVGDPNGHSVNINMSNGSVTISPPQYTLTVSVSPAGSGTITLDPPGGTYDEGTVVWVNATPNAGYVFDHWSGDASGNNSTVQIIMDANKTITAHFALLAPPQPDFITITFGTENEIPPGNMSTGFTFTMYATAFNTSTKGSLGPIPVNWSIANYGSNASINTSFGTSVLFSSGTQNGTTLLTIDDGSGHTDNVTFVISEGFFTLRMYQGWNLITIPVQNSYNASDLAARIDGCEMLAWWNAATSTFTTFIVGITPPGSPWDFAINDGIGYYVKVANDTLLTLPDTPLGTVNVTLYTGWNTIGWWKDVSTTASSLSGNITNCTMLAMYDAATGSYTVFLVGITPPGSPYDFAVTRGMGLFAKVTSGSVWHGEG